MIENIRKYTGLMIVVLVLLFVGLTFFGSDARSAITGGTAMEIDSKAITPKEFQRLAVNSQRIPSFFSPYSEGGATLNRANYILGAGNPDDTAATTRYLANRYAVRQAGIDYGVTPNIEEVQRYIREALFANADGSFDQKRYDDFLVNQLGQLGMNSRDFNEVLIDLLTANNLLDLIGAGLSPDLEMTRALYEDSAQTLSASQIMFPRAQYLESITPTEEDIKEYWEKNKAKYLTEEQRKVTYILAQPDWDAELKKVEAAEAKEEEASTAVDKKAKENDEDDLGVEEEEEEEEIDEIDSAPASDAVIENVEPTDPSEIVSAGNRQGDSEAVLSNPTIAPDPAAEEAKEATPAGAQGKLSPEQRIEAVKSLNGIIDDFWQTVYDEKGANFEKIAKDFKFEPVATKMFTLENAPQILKTQIDGERGGTVAQRVFRGEPGGSLEERMSDVFRTEEGYIIFRLDGNIKAEELSYEAAKERVTADLKIELAIKAMQDDAKAKHAALKKALADGKSLADAAEELELTVTTSENLTQPPSQFGYSPPAPPSFDLARRLAPGELSELKALPNDAEPLTTMMVVLNKREITADEAYQTGLDQLYQNHQQSLEIMAFQNWLNEQYLKNNVRSSQQ